MKKQRKTRIHDSGLGWENSLRLISVKTETQAFIDMCLLPSHLRRPRSNGNGVEQPGTPTS